LKENKKKNKSYIIYEDDNNTSSIISYPDGHLAYCNSNWCDRYGLQVIMTDIRITDFIDNSGFPLFMGL